MPTNYQRGRAIEYQAIHMLKEQGYAAQRTAGSHGPFDIIAWNADSIRLIQIKGTRGPTAITTALTKARNTWRDTPIPRAPAISLEVWVKERSKWHVFKAI